jgi:hypothetical protein
LDFLFEKQKRIVGENDLLCVSNRREESSDGIVRNLTSKKEPVNSAVEGKLGGRAGENKQNQIEITLNSTND